MWTKNRSANDLSMRQYVLGQDKVEKMPEKFGSEMLCSPED